MANQTGKYFGFSLALAAAQMIAVSATGAELNEIGAELNEIQVERFECVDVSSPAYRVLGIVRFWNERAPGCEWLHNPRHRVTVRARARLSRQ